MKHIGIVASFTVALVALGVVVFGMYTFANLPIIPPEITYYTRTSTERVANGGNWGQFAGLGLMIALSLVASVTATIVGGCLVEQANR